MCRDLSFVLKRSELVKFDVYSPPNAIYFLTWRPRRHFVNCSRRVDMQLSVVVAVLWLSVSLAAYPEMILSIAT